ncbi:telomere binding protein [Squirrelpox virus]|uniref:Telomere binding protein n=1 Tax=Squirrelpox virus TaxID=240426 RepID=U3UBG2_9POXV|nr:telomere binding protein [Squirrelpox virus]CCD83224.1 telomere binding protein [Squirrelpox virus]
MNHFIKQAGAGIRKPSYRATVLPHTHRMRYGTLVFDFEDFYYNNDELFHKPTNAVCDVTKSLAVMRSFRHEQAVLRRVVRLVRSRGAHVSDVFFAPVGWLAGTGDPPYTHAAVRVLHADDGLEGAARALLEGQPVRNVDWLRGEETEMQSIAVPNIQPVGLITFYPFDVDEIAAILFFGAVDEARCGVVYTAPREYTDAVVRRLATVAGELYMLVDGVGALSPVRLAAAGQRAEKLRESSVDVLCEVTRRFDLAGLEPSESPAARRPLVPKMIVSPLDLPSHVEIRCESRNGVDFVTHIDGRRLDTVLVVAKDEFLSGTRLKGVFVKENLVWRGTYTYRIVSSSFPAPKLAVRRRHKRRECKKHCFCETAFTTRTRTHVV